MSASRGAPDLYAVTDRRQMPAGFAAAIESALAAGLGWLQVREKELPAAELLALARAAVTAARPRGARVLVNDRADVAVLAGADGVQLTEAGLDPGAVRAAFPGLLVGVSTHSLGRAEAAAAAGADFVVFGPVFATPAKAAHGPPQGIAALAAVARAVAVPVVAIGGIGPAEARACHEAGAAGVAAIRGLLGTADPAAAVRAFRAAVALSRGAPPPPR